MLEELFILVFSKSILYIALKRIVTFSFFINLKHFFFNT